VNTGKEKGVFDIAKRTYAQQFSQMYFVRLASLAPVLRSSAQKKWTSSKGANSSPGKLLINCVVVFVNRLLDVKPGVLSCIIGTIYVDMEFKPNVLQELACDVF
jgi:DNA polymerase delta subunit 2